eukprot:285212-Pyramimonas_sp.AAC.1
MPGLVCPRLQARTAAAVRDHPLRTPMVSRKCHACCAWTIGAHSGRGERPPLAHPLMVSRKCLACYALGPGRPARIEIPPPAHPPWCR